MIKNNDTKFTLWLKSQWTESLAKSIFDDLSVMGRFTVWIPLWLVCWVALPFTLPALLICVWLEKLDRKIRAKDY
tara:strand:+ start:279 stop:503 length:225 start_codon:yes stop_codon:yes gene_type:complete